MDTAIIYSFSSEKTAAIAKKITKAFGKEFEIKHVNADDISEEEFLRHSNLIIGTSTWFDGELPNYWDEFVPALEDMNLKGKTIAIFGLGDQVGYPENFADAVGILGTLFRSNGAKLAGYTDNEDYEFETSQALENEKFMGLILDEENQSRLTNARIEKWVETLKKSFANI